MLRNLAFLLGRLLIAAVFVFDATLLVRNFDGNLSYVTGVGIPNSIPPNVLLAAVILLQFLGGLLVVIGLWTRLAALALAAFCIATAILFHWRPNVDSELIQAGKDFAIAGGFLFLAFTGPGRWSVDARRNAAV